LTKFARHEFSLSGRAIRPADQALTSTHIAVEPGEDARHCVGALGLVAVHEDMPAGRILIDFRIMDLVARFQRVEQAPSMERQRCDLVARRREHQ
jgi:hypothetical protein